MISETATAASILPTLSSRKTVVGSTSVRIRVAPEKTRIGPNSPSDRAQASVAAVSRPRRASGSDDRSRMPGCGCSRASAPPARVAG